MAITQTITGFSGLPPSTTDPTNFDERASTTLEEMYDLPGEVNTWATQANALAVEVNSAATSAETSATTAEEAADAVLSQGSTANAWSSVTTYSQYQVAIGSDGRAYRSLQAGNLNHNPVTDTGTWWLALNPDPNLVAVLCLGTGFYPGWAASWQGPFATNPPTDPSKPTDLVLSKGVYRYRATYTWGTTGGELNNVVTMRMRYSVNSGSTWLDVSTTPTVTMTYNADGYVTSAAWS